MMKKAQSTLEYAALIAVVVAAMLAMHLYFQRGLEGRMRSSSDDVGDQYDIDKGGYRSRSSLQGDRTEINVKGKYIFKDDERSGNLAMDDITAPGEGASVRYTAGNENQYEMRREEVIKTDSMPDELGDW